MKNYFYFVHHRSQSHIHIYFFKFYFIQLFLLCSIWMYKTNRKLIVWSWKRNFYILTNFSVVNSSTSLVRLRKVGSIKAAPMNVNVMLTMLEMERFVFDLRLSPSFYYIYQINLSYLPKKAHICDLTLVLLCMALILTFTYWLNNEKQNYRKSLYGPNKFSHFSLIF